MTVVRLDVPAGSREDDPLVSIRLIERGHHTPVTRARQLF